MLVDRAAYRFVASRADEPDDGTVARVRDEIDRALDLFDRRGWISAPETYHQDPPTPQGVRTSPARSATLRYTAMSWLDGYAPRPEEPGAERFAGRSPNRVARVALLEHRSGDRPWLVCLHGFGMGAPGLDLRAFRARHLYGELGLNVAFLTLPFHGRRSPTGFARPGMPSADVLDTIHGLSQALWDARQLLAHLRTLTDRPIGVMGLSLGGLVAALAASVDEPDAVLLLVPAVDLPTLMAEAVVEAGGGATALQILDRARPLYTPISPLHLTPRVPHDRRFVLAGTLDRFARPSTQAAAIWRHWDEPAMHWYHGGHVSVFWARGRQEAIDATLRRTLLS